MPGPPRPTKLDAARLRARADEVDTGALLQAVISDLLGETSHAPTRPLTTENPAAVFGLVAGKPAAAGSVGLVRSLQLTAGREV